MSGKAGKIVKAAAAAGGAYLALGEIVYECVVNIGFNRVIKSTGLFESKEKVQFYDNCTIRHEAEAWYDEQGVGDTVLYSDRLHRQVFCKTYINEEKTDNWAIINHGYTDSIRKRAHWIQKYLEMGFNVVAPHMVGHDSDKSNYCSMGYYDKLLVLDIIDYILEVNKNAKIVIHGVSMGAATTMMVTGENLPSNVVAAVEDCGYTSCFEEYKSQVGPILHLPFMSGIIVNAANTVSKIRGNFDFREASPIKAIVHSKTPTLFIHGAADKFVPYEMMEPLYEACGAKDKKMLTIPDAFHAAAAYFDNDLYWNTVKEFIGKYVDVK